MSGLENFREYLTELGAGKLGIDLLTVWLVVSVVLTLATCLSLVLVMTPVSLFMIVSFLLMVVVATSRPQLSKPHRLIAAAMRYSTLQYVTVKNHSLSKLSSRTPHLNPVL